MFNCRKLLLLAIVCFIIYLFARLFTGWKWDVLLATSQSLRPSDSALRGSSTETLWWVKHLLASYVISVLYNVRTSNIESFVWIRRIKNIVATFSITWARILVAQSTFFRLPRAWCPTKSSRGVGASSRSYLLSTSTGYRTTRPVSPVGPVAVNYV